MTALAASNISPVADESHEIQPLLQKNYALRSQHSQKLNRRCPKYKLAKISEKGAIFMIIWNLFFTTALFSCFTPSNSTKNTAYIVMFSSSIVFPVVGLLTDVWIGTFRILKLSLYFLLAAIILKSIYTFIILPDIILYLSFVAWSLAGVCYLASIIQLTTAQLIGPSGEELSLTISVSYTHLTLPTKRIV